MDASAYAVIGPPAAVTLPALAEGNVRCVVGTLFVQQRILQGEKAVNGPWCYNTPDEAYTAAMRQIQTYQTWQRQGKIEIVTAGSEFLSGREQVKTPGGAGGLGVILLMEGAAPLRSVGDLAGFHAAGVRVISLTWAEGTQWSGGNESLGDITPAGRQLVAEIDRLNMIHDVSHLSEQAFHTLLHIASGPKIASHSNCRDLLPGRENNERNLTDEQIRLLVKAGGMIGLNLFTNFLAVGRRATIADAVNHIRHIVQLAGRMDIIGLGSDMDGGFLPSAMPVGLEHPRKLHRLAEALSDAHFSDADIEKFTWQNWTNFFERYLR
jgi:membrane dipeptidase